MPTQTVAPFLNDYKRKFLIKRLLENLIGGIALSTDSDETIPWFVYLIQLVLFVVPFLLGGFFILITDINLLGRLYASIIAAVVFIFYLIVLKLILVLVINKIYLNKYDSSPAKEKKLDSSNSKTTNRVSNEPNSTLTFINFIFPSVQMCVHVVNKTYKLDKLKLFKYVVHVVFDSLIAGFIMFCGVHFESIVYLQSIQFSLGGAICIFIFNWIVLCLALYGLCIRVPAEPAVYQPYDNLNIQHYSRAFYIICFQLTEIINCYALSNSIFTAIFALKIILNVFPILWLLGLLPPIDSCILYFLEQIYIHIYGGSATSTNLRLIAQLFFAVIVSLAHFIPNDLTILIIFALFGYVLSSVDLIFLIEKFLEKVTNNTVYPAEAKILADKKINNQSNVSHLSWKDWAFHFVIIALILVSSIVPFVSLQSNKSGYSYFYKIEMIILNICIGLFVLIKVLSDLQGVYLFFGLFRNPFYPTNCMNSSVTKNQIVSINQNRIFFKLIKYLRIIFIRVVAPLILIVVISIDCAFNKIYGTTLSYWRTLIVLRAFRWVWQSSFMCLFEMSFLVNIILFDIIYNSTADSILQTNIIQYFLTACLLASFVRDRLEQFLNKLFAFFLLTITAWTVKKQRSKKALAAIIVNFLLLIPFGIILILLASLLSAPLLPLFTFPVFLIGFPRTKRFWPQRTPFFSFNSSKASDSTAASKKTQGSSSDSNFYAQLVPQLLPSFKELTRSASIGSALQPDTFFLSRFQDRIIWIQIMESSSSYYILNIKGLELQETSCHTRESQYIDDCFDLAFENANGAGANSSSERKCCLLNPSPFNCMQSCDLLLFDAYSDAKNSLVGILDNPETINQITLFYPKVLHYFLIKYLIGRKMKPNESQIVQNDLKSLFTSDETKSDAKGTLLNDINHTSDNQQKVIDILKNENQETLKRNKLPSINSLSNLDSNENKAHEKINKITENWSDSSDSEFDDISKKKPKETKLNLKVADENPFDFDLNEILGTSSKKEGTKIDIDMGNLNKETSRSDYNYEDAKTPPNKSFKTTRTIEETKETCMLIDENTSLMSLPTEWTKFLNDNLNSSQSQMNESKLMKTALMSSKWTGDLLDLIGLVTSSENMKTKRKEWLTDYENGFNVNHFVFVLKCCITLGLNENKISPNLNPFSLEKFYSGDLPFSPVNQKLTKEHPTLHQLLVKAFQYTVKMVIDHSTICPITDDAELLDSIKTYEEDWFIGTENETDYATSILNNRNFLFSLYKDPQKKSLNSRTLSLQKIKSPLAQMNSEIVKSIWSSTNLELLFMTNDDDERYSIQAHQYILRNLTIQSSDPPLGYCVYNSENIYLPCVNPF